MSNCGASERKRDLCGFVVVVVVVVVRHFFLLAAVCCVSSKMLSRKDSPFPLLEVIFIMKPPFPSSSGSPKMKTPLSSREFKSMQLCTSFSLWIKWIITKLR